MLSTVFGVRKYKWLVERKQLALILNENIDDFYLKLFLPIDLSHAHSKEDYNDLLEILELRHNNETSDLLDMRSLCINQVFPLELICTVAVKITSDTPLIAWEIIYRMMKLYCPSYGCDAPLLYRVLQRLEDRIDSKGNRTYGILSTISILISSEDKSFGYISFFIHVLRKRLSQRRLYCKNERYPSTEFTETIHLSFQKAVSLLELKKK